MQLISKLIGLLCSNFNASLSNLTPISITKTNLKRMLMPYIRNYKYESQPQHLVILTCKPPVKRNSSTAVNKYATFVPSRYNQQAFLICFSKITNSTKLSRLGLTIISNCKKKSIDYVTLIKISNKNKQNYFSNNRASAVV